MCNIFVYQCFKSFWPVTIKGFMITLNAPTSIWLSGGLGQLTDKTKKTNKTAAWFKPCFKNQAYSHCPTPSNAKYKEKDVRED